METFEIINLVVMILRKIYKVYGGDGGNRIIYIRY